MKKLQIYSWILFICCFVACSGNDNIGTVETWEDEYVFPQGKSDADERLLGYYNLYGTYILYDYTYLDFRYEFPGYSSYRFVLPDPSNVGDMLDLLDDIWFDFYPVEFHKEYMPLKIILADAVESESAVDGSITSYFVLSGVSAIIFGHCSDTLQKITPAVKLGFKNELQTHLWTNWMDEIEVPDEFYEVSDYSSVADADPASDNYARKRGFVSNYDLAYEWSIYSVSESEDLRTYLVHMAICSSEDWASDLEYPLVRQKYDILRNWLKEKYGFDLQTVGDTFYE